MLVFRVLCVFGQTEGSSSIYRYHFENNNFKFSIIRLRKPNRCIKKPLETEMSLLFPVVLKVLNHGLLPLFIEDFRTFAHVFTVIFWCSKVFCFAAALFLFD